MEKGSSFKVLIIEDDPADRRIYEYCLRDSLTYRFQFLEAGTAAEGLALVGSSNPDCVLLDFNLPDMDGLQVLSHLRAGHDRVPVAVVMLTAFGREELAVRAMRAGAMDYLPKRQVSADVLPQLVANAIQRFQLLEQVDEQRRVLDRNARHYQALFEAIPQMVWMTDAQGCIGYANRQWLDYTGISLGNTDHFLTKGLLHVEDRERTLATWKRALHEGSTFEIEHRMRRNADGAYLWHLVRAVPFRNADGEVTHWFGTCTGIENQKQAEAAHLQNEKLWSIGRLAGGLAHELNNLLVTILGGTSYAMGQISPSEPAQAMLRSVVSAGERAAQLTSRLLAYAGKGAMFVEPADLNRVVNDACNSLRSSIPTKIQLHVSIAKNPPPVATDIRQLKQAIVDLVTNAVEAIGEENAGTITVCTGSLETCGDPSQAVAAGKYAVLEVRDTGCGMDREMQTRIFDPFFTTKFMGRGLGLAAVQGFAQSAGGAVQVESAAGEGARFRILLPECQREAGLRGVAS